MGRLFCWRPWTSCGPHGKVVLLVAMDVLWASWEGGFVGSHGRLVKSCCVSVCRSECSKLRQELTAQKDDEKRAALEHLSKLKDEAFAAERAGFENRLTHLNRQVGTGACYRGDTLKEGLLNCLTHLNRQVGIGTCYREDTLKESLLNCLTHLNRQE